MSDMRTHLQGGIVNFHLIGNLSCDSTGVCGIYALLTTMWCFILITVTLLAGCVVAIGCQRQGRRLNFFVTAKLIRCYS